MKLRTLISVLLLSVLGVSVAPGLVPALGIWPTIQMSPQCITSGQLLTITGSGFDGNAVVTFQLQTYEPPNTAQFTHEFYADTNGNFNETFVMPPIPYGWYQAWAIEAWPRASGVQTGFLQVVPSCPVVVTQTKETMTSTITTTSTQTTTVTVKVVTYITFTIFNFTTSTITSTVTMNQTTTQTITVTVSTNSTV